MPDNEQTNEVDAQKEFLMAKINEMTDGVAPGYGEGFLEELMKRLEKTVADFNEEVTALLDMLKFQSLERNDKLKELIEKGDATGPVKPEKLSAEAEMSDWEKKLESKDDKAFKKASSDEEPTHGRGKEKKGFFRRKKKKTS